MAQDMRRATKHLRCTYEATHKLKQHYIEAQEKAKMGEPVVWILLEPVELLWAMDIIPLGFLNYTSVIAAKQLSPYYLELTEERGYYRDLCRYASRNMLGYVFDHNPEKAPWGGLAQPRAMVAHIPCDPMAKLFEVIAREMNIPLFTWEQLWPPEPCEWFPLDNEGRWNPEAEARVDPRRIDNYVKALEELIVFLEEHTGKRLKESRLRRAVGLEAEMFGYYYECDEYRMARPAPISAGDWLPQAIPYIWFAGTEWGVEYCRKLRDEIKQRVEQGIGLVDKERHRLMYIGVPPWFAPGFFEAFQEDYGAVFVWEAYHIPKFYSRLDPAHPLESIARKYIDIGGNASLCGPAYAAHFLPAARIPGNINGAIIGRAESCKSISSGLILCRRELEKIGIPSMELAMDYVDPRDWDDARVKAQVGNFIETLTPLC
ncbi:(R)-2-hydroxyisocaproyl-CoA dehydratase alpha subunit [subsurface metagenome]